MSKSSRRRFKNEIRKAAEKIVATSLRDQATKGDAKDRQTVLTDAGRISRFWRNTKVVRILRVFTLTRIVVGAAIAAVGAFVTIASVLPRVAVEPGVCRDAKSPLTTIFSFQNQSLFPIFNVRCTPLWSIENPRPSLLFDDQMSSEEILMMLKGSRKKLPWRYVREWHCGLPVSTAKRVNPSEKIALDYVFRKYPEGKDPVVFQIELEYATWIGLRKTERFSFTARPDTQGNFQWIPSGFENMLADTNYSNIRIIP